MDGAADAGDISAQILAGGGANAQPQAQAQPQANISGDPIVALASLAGSSPLGTVTLSPTITGFSIPITIPADDAANKIVGYVQEQKSIEREMGYRLARMQYFGQQVNNFDLSYDQRMGAYQAVQVARAEMLQLYQAWQQRGQAIVASFGELQQNLVAAAQTAAAAAAADANEAPADGEDADAPAEEPAA